MIQHIDYTNANADVFAFDRGEGVKEYHAIMHVTDCRLTFHAQLDALMNAYQQLIEGELKGTVAVFKRYFLSDAANQADEVAVADSSDCAKSIVEQAPLDGTKIALWVYLLTDVE